MQVLLHVWIWFKRDKTPIMWCLVPTQNTQWSLLLFSLTYKKQLWPEDVPQAKPVSHMTHYLSKMLFVLLKSLYFFSTTFYSPLSCPLSSIFPLPFSQSTFLSLLPLCFCFSRAPSNNSVWFDLNSKPRVLQGAQPKKNDIQNIPH